MSRPTRDPLTLPVPTAAEEPARHAASVVFNLSGYTVIVAVDLPLGGRRVVVTAQDQEGTRPSCGTGP